MKKLLLHLFMHVGKLLGGELRSALAKHGISHGQARILQALTRAGRINQASLARVLHIKPPTVSRMIASMEKQGLVDRARDPRDVRVITVSLTRRGKKAAATVVKVWGRTEAKVLKSLKPGQRRMLQENLVNIRDSLGGEPPDWSALSDGEER